MTPERPAKQKGREFKSHKSKTILFQIIDHQLLIFLIVNSKIIELDKVYVFFVIEVRLPRSMSKFYIGLQIRPLPPAASRKPTVCLLIYAL